MCQLKVQRRSRQGVMAELRRAVDQWVSQTSDIEYVFDKPLDADCAEYEERLRTAVQN